MESVGIHPGVIGGRRIHDRANTAKPWKGKSTRLSKRRGALGRRRLAREATVTDLGRGGTKKIDYAAAFRPPGSMNQHKR